MVSEEARSKSVAKEEEEEDAEEKEDALVLDCETVEEKSAGRENRRRANRRRLFDLFIWNKSSLEAR